MELLEKFREIIACLIPEKYFLFVYFIVTLTIFLVIMHFFL